MLDSFLIATLFALINTCISRTKNMQHPVAIKTVCTILDVNYFAADTARGRIKTGTICFSELESACLLEPMHDSDQLGFVLADTTDRNNLIDIFALLRKMDRMIVGLVCRFVNLDAAFGFWFWFGR